MCLRIFSPQVQFFFLLGPLLFVLCEPFVPHGSPEEMIWLNKHLLNLKTMHMVFIR